MTEYGIRWMEFNSKGQLVSKLKLFKTEKGRDDFGERIMMKDNFYRITARYN